MKIMKKGHKSQAGQGMSEYLIIVGLIAVACIGVFGFFGDTVSNQMAGMAQEIAGADGSQDQQDAVTSADGASGQAATHNDLSNYHDNGSGAAGGGGGGGTTP